MNTKPAPVVQAGVQDVVPLPIKYAIARAWCHAENSAKEMDADLAYAIAREISEVLESALFWRQMEIAPVGDPSACIDIWCGQNDCRYVDCYWDRPQEPYGKPAAEPCWVREEYEVGYGFYAVAVANPVAWMPAPGKPEGV